MTHKTSGCVRICVSVCVPPCGGNWLGFRRPHFSRLLLQCLKVAVETSSRSRLVPPRISLSDLAAAAGVRPQRWRQESLPLRILGSAPETKSVCASALVCVCVCMCLCVCAHVCVARTRAGGREVSRNSLSVLHLLLFWSQSTC